VDEAKVFRRVECEVDKEAFQRDLDQLADWAKKWQLRFNIEKFKTMHLGGIREGRVSYSMERPDGKRVTLQETTEEIDLRVWVDRTVKPTIHVAHAAMKANQLLGLIRRTFTYLDCDIVRQHLEYANIVWHPYFKKDIELLERVQHGATKMMPGLRHLTYEERLRKMYLPTLVYWRARGDAIDTYKYLNGNYMVDYTQLLKCHQTRGLETRGNGWKLQKKSSQSNLRSNFYSIRIVNLWNSLLEEVVGALSVNCFKGRFERLCEENRFNMMRNEVGGGKGWTM